MFGLSLNTYIGHLLIKNWAFIFLGMWRPLSDYNECPSPCRWALVYISSTIEKSGVKGGKGKDDL